MKNSIFSPFENVTNTKKTLIVIFWISLLLVTWIYLSNGEKHLFPSPKQVFDGLISLFKEGLVNHIFNSLSLCFRATIYALLITLVIIYLSPVPAINPIAHFLSKLRFLPLTGLTYYATIIIKDARSMQIWVLMVFMIVYLITALMAVLSDIPKEEYDHAKSLKCSRWEMLFEVIIKGRFDYVIEVLRQNLAIIWMMLVSVESILVASGGLGVLIKNSDKFMNHGRIIALQIVILLIGLTLDWFLNLQRKLLFRYSKF